MDTKLYFIIGDLVTNLVAGVFVALVCYFIIGQNWNMFVAMEVMVPVMMTGMVSGMVVGMMAAMQEISVSEVMLTGAGVGLISVCTIWFLNSRIRGIQNEIKT